MKCCEYYYKQECIPVGFIPAAHWPYGSDPLNFSLGCGPGSDPPQFPPWLWAWIRSFSTSPLGMGLGVSLPGGGSSFWGVSLPGGSPCQGVSLPGGSPCQGSLLGRLPPVNRITHSCKNITLATTSLRPVITCWIANMFDTENAKPLPWLTDYHVLPPQLRHSLRK